MRKIELWLKQVLGIEQKPEMRNSYTNIFDQPFYADITEARLEHFKSLSLPLTGKSVVDVGCGIGRLAEAFDDFNCDVLCVDGRPENIQKLKELYPLSKTAVIDFDSEEFFNLGKFDVVFCYGLLYHLSDPFGFIKKAYNICKEVMVIETCIIDSELPEVLLVEEDQTNETQALQQFGCRPSPSYVIACLKLSGFKYVYQPTNLPDHFQFKYKRKNNHSYIRNGHLIRDIFIASHEVIENDNLRACV